MKIDITLTKNTTPVPFNYQKKLTGCVHTWIGKNNLEHGRPSFYSFSWLKNVKAVRQGLQLTPSSYVTLSFYELELTKQVVSGIMKHPNVFSGIKVKAVYLGDQPNFGTRERFIVDSPVFIKRFIGEKKEKHYTYKDKESGMLLTETLKNKLRTKGLDDTGVQVEFDTSYSNPKSKVITYGPVRNKVSICPVYISGTPEQIAFAYQVGVGNSTGIGFGALSHRL